MIDIQILTTRTISDSDYDQWIMDMQLSGIPLDGKRLWDKGDFLWISPDSGGGQPAVTTIKIKKK